MFAIFITLPWTILLNKMMLEKKYMDFVIPETGGLLNYTHKTKTESIANQIMKQGFEFVDSLQKTTDSVTADPVHLQYWHNLRERYGSYTIVISISKAILDHYILKLNKKKQNQVAVEQLLTIKKPWIDDNDEEVYTLPPEFIKGWFNHKTGIIVNNPIHNPNYTSPVFEENFDTLL